MFRCCEIHQQVQHITKNLPNMAMYPQKHLRNSTNPSSSFSYRHHKAFTGHVHGKQMGFSSNLFTHIICAHCSNEGKKSAENVVQAYLSGILAHKDGSEAILSDKGTEFKKTKMLMKHVINLELRGYYEAYSIPR